MDIIVTRFIGILGTAILAREFESGLRTRYPKWLVDEAISFDDDVDRIEENDIDVIKSMGDRIAYLGRYTEFGVFEALFQMSRFLKCGMDIEIKSIPIKQETVEVCEFTGADPYLLYSGVSCVLACENGEDIIRELAGHDIPAFKVGITTSTNDKIVINESERGFLPHVRKDELKRILGKKVYYERTDFIRN